jgi:hypothetical protein
METIEGFDFQPIEIDRHGQVQTGANELATHVKDHAVSDVIIICHGFRNDDNDARSLYTKFLKTFKENLQRGGAVSALAGRTYAVGGVFWPSMVLPEPNDSQGAALSVGAGDDRQRLERMKATSDAKTADKIEAILRDLPKAEDDGNARVRMASSLLDLVRQLPQDGNEARAAFADATPESLVNALTAGDAVVVGPAGGGTGGAGGIPQLGPQAGGVGGGLSVLGKVFGFVPKFVNLTTFLLMFNRCGDVGEKGISDVVRRVKKLSNARVHLVGHSLGGRAVTACAKALIDAPAQNVDTMMLLEAAYSHFGLSAGTGASGINHPRGFFRDVIEKKVVNGPILATHSTHDAVVQFAYTPMAAVSGNNARAIGDENSPFGGIGRNGVLDTKEAEKLDLQVAGGAYTFKRGSIHNLNGSRDVNGNPLIRSHGDVTNAAVTWAFACLLATP